MDLSRATPFWTALASCPRSRHRIRVGASINSPSSRGNRNRNRVKQGSSLFQFHRSRVCSAHIMRPAAPVGRSARREHSWFLTTRSVDPLLPNYGAAAACTQLERRVEYIPSLLSLSLVLTSHALRCLLAGCMICVFVSAWWGLPFFAMNDCRELP